MYIYESIFYIYRIKREYFKKKSKKLKTKNALRENLSNPEYYEEYAVLLAIVLLLAYFKRALIYI